MFWSGFIFLEYSTREPASSRVAYFILQAYTGTSISHSSHRKNSGEVLEKMQVNLPGGKKAAATETITVTVYNNSNIRSNIHVRYDS